MTPETSSTRTREIAVYSLAVVGFISLIALGIALAVYVSRYAPRAVSNIGSAAVYLSQWFNPAQEPSLSSTTATSTSIRLGTQATSTKTSASTTAKTTPKPTPAVKPGPKTTTVYQVGGATSTPVLFGFPDLIVTIESVGYLATSSPESFVATSTVPTGSHPAVKFTIKNVGTNVAAPWRFSASIPTRSAFIFQSPLQQPLNPGDSIEYTLGFDQASGGTDQMISITANFDHTIAESLPNNNSASTKVTILGS